MSYRLGGRNPLAYMGVEPSQPPQMLIETRSPTINDNQYNIGTYWFIAAPPPTDDWELWILADLTAGIATWLQLYPGSSGGIIRLDADMGFAVPILGIVNVFGGPNINTTGDDVQTLHVNLNETIHWPATSSDGLAGAIYLNGSNGSGGSLFMHDYGTDNTWLGINAGNLKLTVVDATDNTGIGQEALTNITTGFVNSAGGSLSQNSLTTGTGNSSWGAGSLLNLVSGNNNIAIGQESASTYTTNESNNIIIGSPAVIADQNTIRIGVEGTQTAAYMAGIYDEPIGMPNAIVYVDSTGKLAPGSPIPPPPLPGGVIITIFDTSGTFVINPQTKIVQYYIWSAGSGGGSGACGPAPSSGGLSGGGGGGASGCASFSMTPATFFNPAGEAVIVGMGGTGGASVSASNTIGNDGTVGGNSQLGNFILPNWPFASAGAGLQGKGGILTGVTTFEQSPYLINLESLSVLGAGGPGQRGGGASAQNNGSTLFVSTGNGGTVNYSASYIAGTSGGGGSGGNSTSAMGGRGGNVISIDLTITMLAGGAGGAGDSDGADGNPPPTTGAVIMGGTGGGGGGGYVASRPGNGGNGAFPSGGGGGGGAGVNAVIGSGTGGNGANGRVMTIEYL